MSRRLPEQARPVVMMPPRCAQCDRPIYPKTGGWVHKNGNAHCYDRAGNKHDAKPRGSK